MIRFQKQGALGPDTFYLPRSADQKLWTLLRERQTWCHVLASRQVGKSSLRARMITRLRGVGVRVAWCEVSGLGGFQVEVQQFCFSLACALYETARRAKEGEAEPVWDEREVVTPVQRLGASVRALVKEDSSPLVIFLDEIDAVMDLSFASDILTGLRGLLNGRADDADLRRLTVCLIGSAPAVQMAPDMNHSPFNGESVDLVDFTRDEIAGFEPGLQNLGASPVELLDEVHHWTQGHPSLSQHVCATLVEEGPSTLPTKERVAAIVQRLFIQPRHADERMNDIARRFTDPRKPEIVQGMLERYGEVLRRQAKDQGNDELQEALRIAGLVRVEGGRLLPRNAVFETVFDLAWVRSRRSEDALARAAREWVESERDESKLLKGGTLTGAITQSRDRSDLTPHEREFVARSVEADRQREALDRARATRDARRRLGLLGVFGALSVLLTGTSVGFWQASSRAQRLEGRYRREADERAEDARRYEDAAVYANARYQQSILAIEGDAGVLIRTLQQDLGACQGALDQERVLRRDRNGVVAVLNGRLDACDAGYQECQRNLSNLQTEHRELRGRCDATSAQLAACERDGRDAGAQLSACEIRVIDAGLQCDLALTQIRAECDRRVQAEVNADGGACDRRIRALILPAAQPANPPVQPAVPPAPPAVTPPPPAAPPTQPATSS